MLGKAFVNKSQLIDSLSSHFEGNKRAARHALESVLATVTREVARGEKVAIAGFGAFEKKVVRPAAEKARSARTTKQDQAASAAAPQFTAGPTLKAVVSGEKPLPEPAASPSPVSAVTAKPPSGAQQISDASADVTDAGSTSSRKGVQTTSSTGTTRKRPASTTSAAGVGKASTGRRTAKKASTAGGAAGKPASRRSTGTTGRTGATSAGKRSARSAGTARASSGLSQVEPTAEASITPPVLWSEEGQEPANDQGTGGSVATPPPA